MKRMRRLFLTIFAILLAVLAFSPLSVVAKKPQVMALADLKPGTKAIGFSVFRGVEPEPFDVELGEIYGNMGMPYIYARISGGPLETKLEVMGPPAGISGSPVFIECANYEECIDRGVLVGAVSLGVSKIPLGGMNAGITPAEKMLGASSGGYTAVQNLFSSPMSSGHILPLPVAVPPGLDASALPKNTLAIPSPIAAAQAHETGVTQTKLKPGSMIALFLAYGDIPLPVWGTVTWVDEDHIYAFGHPFNGTGASSYPFAQISVASTIQNPLDPYKMMGRVIGNWGVITLDGVTEIEGVIGKHIEGIPLQATLQIGSKNFLLQENITPQTQLTDALLQQLPAFWISRVAGDAKNLSLTYRVRIVLAGEPEILLQNIIGAAFKQNPVGKFSAVLAGAFGSLNASGYPYALESIRLDVGLAADATLWQKEKVFLSKTEALPGETVTLSIILRSFPDGTEFRQIDVPITVPADFLSRNPFMPPTPDTAALPMFFGNVPLNILVQGGPQFTDISLNHKPPRSMQELIGQINQRGNRRPDTIYIQQILPPKIKKEIPLQEELRTAPLPKGAKKEKPPHQARRMEASSLPQAPESQQASPAQLPLSAWRVVDPSAIPQEEGTEGRPEVILHTLPPIDGIPNISEKLTLLVKAPPPVLTGLEPVPPKKKKHFLFF